MRLRFWKKDEDLPEVWQEADGTYTYRDTAAQQKAAGVGEHVTDIYKPHDFADFLKPPTQKYSEANRYVTAWDGTKIDLNASVFDEDDD